MLSDLTAGFLNWVKAEQVSWYQTDSCFELLSFFFFFSCFLICESIEMLRLQDRESCQFTCISLLLRLHSSYLAVLWP